MSRRMFIVDVFAESKYAGNQLAIIADADGLTTEQMQRIALEMNYSETTFLLSDRPVDGGWDVRIFTPREEVPFAGHPTLGTAYLIRHELIREPCESVLLNLRVGQIPVTFERENETENGDGEVLWMHQPAPEFGQTIPVEDLARVLNTDPGCFDLRYPIQEVSTGLPFIIAPLRDLESVRRARINREAYDELIRNRPAKAILFFSPETYESDNQINARMFADYFGVPEDSATGSANGCLAGWLVHNRYFGGGELAVRVEQGYEIGRPSLLRLRARRIDDGIDVFVGGKVIMVARGELV